MRYLLLALLAISSVSFAQAPSTDFKKQADEMTKGLVAVVQIMGINNQLEGEFMAMTDDLAKLHDPKVSRICLTHLRKVEKLVRQREKLQAAIRSEKP